jgi:HEPN domain-containing protein
MKPPDSEILRKVIQWLEYGDEDLRLARHGLTLTSGVPYRLIAYHAQQCAEKHLKAFLVYHEIDFPYTHNIGRL